MFYKAIEKYYTKNEYGTVQYKDIVGFGYCNNLEEMQKRYASHIILEEITEQELQELWAELNKQSEKSQWD